MPAGVPPSRCCPSAPPRTGRAYRTADPAAQRGCPHPAAHTATTEARPRQYLMLVGSVRPRGPRRLHEPHSDGAHVVHAHAPRRDNSGRAGKIAVAHVLHQLIHVCLSQNNQHNPRRKTATARWTEREQENGQTRGATASVATAQTWHVGCAGRSAAGPAVAGHAARAFSCRRVTGAVAAALVTQGSGGASWRRRSVVAPPHGFCRAPGAMSIARAAPRCIILCMAMLLRVW
jgi:hypothetical protein